MRMLAPALVLAVLLSTACSGPEPETKEPVLRPVRTVTISENTGGRERTFSGVSQSTQESRISFKVSGTITSLPARAGTQLKAGALLARLNPSSYDLQVQQAEAALAQAQASQRNTESNYDRVKDLYAGNNASRNDLDAARANAESAQAQVQSNKKALEIAQLNRSYTRLTVPEDCVVASLDVELNENINAGAPVALVNCGQGIQVNVGIPESLITNVSEGMPAQVTLNALSNRTFSGTVSEIGTASSGGAATFPIAVTLTETDPSIRSGMAAEVLLKFAQSDSNAITVPASAVLNDETGTFVYLAVPKSESTATIVRKKITTGELVEAGIEVVSGLNIGDKVVTAGTSVIRPNLEVLLPRS
ncbi:MAG: efflux RND transporter periplasmic adaptor subunit [Gammaproteobacteria bacterium]